MGVQYAGRITGDEVDMQVGEQNLSLWPLFVCLKIFYKPAAAVTAIMGL